MTVILYPRQDMQPLALYLHLIPMHERPLDDDCDIWIGPLTAVSANAVGVTLTFTVKEDALRFGLNPDQPQCVVIDGAERGALHFRGELYAHWHICLRQCCENARAQGRPESLLVIGSAINIDDLLMTSYEARTELPDTVDSL